jgi:hypothetical protein
MLMGNPRMGRKRRGSRRDGNYRALGYWENGNGAFYWRSFDEREE